MKTRQILATGLFSLLCAHFASGADGTWSTLTSGNWSDTTKWSGGVVADGIDATANFNSLNLGAATYTVTSNTANRTIGHLIFGDTEVSATSNWALAGTLANALRLQTSTGVPTITSNPLINVATRPNITAVLTGAQGFTKLGAGGMALSGANTFSSGAVVTLEAGLMSMNNNSALGGAAGASLVINGGVLESSNAAISLLTSATHQWNADFTFQGSNNLNLGTGAVVLNGSRTITANANTLIVGGAISSSVADSAFSKMGNGTLTLNGATNYTGTTNLSAGTLNLNGANNYAGGTNIMGGTLRFGSLAGTTVPTAGQFNISSPGTLIAAGPSNFSTAGEWLASGKIATGSTGILAVAGAETGPINMTGYNSLFLAAQSGTTQTITGTITAQGGYRFGGGSAATALQITSNLSGSQGVTLNSGGSTTIFTGNNTYSGVTSVPSAAILRITSDTGLGSSDGETVVSSGGRLELAGGITVNEPLTISGTGVNSTGALNNNSGNNIWAGEIRIGGSGTRIGSSGGTLDITGVITDGPFGTNPYGLVIRNASPTSGIVRLSNFNTYSGTTEIVVGTLQLGFGSLTTGTAIPNSPIVMGNASAPAGGATLDLNGYFVAVGNITRASGIAVPVNVINSNASSIGDLRILQTSAISTGSGPNGLVYGTGVAGGAGNNFSIYKGGNFDYTLETVSTYSGGTFISEGSITAAISGALGTGNVTIDELIGAKLTINTGVLDAIANTATLSLAGGGEALKADAGFLEFAAGGGSLIETVGNLILGGMMQPAGTYGSLTSNAQFKRAEFFLGDGVVFNQAVPEPTALISLLGGLGVLVGARRFRRLG